MIALKQYQAFIDKMVQASACVSANWVLCDEGYPNTLENSEVNNLLASLTPDQKEIISGMLSNAKSAGVHDALAAISDLQNLEGLKIIINDVELPHEPFDSPLHYDYICRLHKDEWPCK